MKTHDHSKRAGNISKKSQPFHAFINSLTQVVMNIYWHQKMQTLKSLLNYRENTQIENKIEIN